MRDRAINVSRRLVPLLFCWLLPLLAPWPSMAVPGVDADSITFGQTARLSGSNVVGLHYRDGILAAFGEQNAQGGVNGRGIAFEKLLVTFGDLIQESAASFDGGLSPWKCIPIYFKELKTPDAAMQPGTTCRRCS